MSVNRVFISGNLTRDCELRSTQGGMAVLTFGVAVNDRAKNPKTGEWEDRPNFIDCVIFGKRAETVQRFISKGSKVAIDGKLRYSSWEKDGQKRSKLEVVVEDIEFLSQSKADSDKFREQPNNYSDEGQSARNSASDGFSGYEYADADIPF